MGTQSHIIENQLNTQTKRIIARCHPLIRHLLSHANSPPWHWEEENAALIGKHCGIDTLTRVHTYFCQTDSRNFAKQIHRVPLVIPKSFQRNTLRPTIHPRLHVLTWTGTREYTRKKEENTRHHFSLYAVCAPVKTSLGKNLHFYLSPGA